MEINKLKLKIEPISLKETNAFILSYHRHNNPVSNNFKFCMCATYGDQLVGVILVDRVHNRHLDDGYTLEVSRCCTRPDAPKNTNSFLYGRAWRVAQAMGYHKLITFTLQEESGSSLRASGFKIVGQTTKEAQWHTRKDSVRKWHPVYGQDKFRWEISDGVDYEPRKKENHSLASGSDDNSQTNLLELLDGQ